MSRLSAVKLSPLENLRQVVQFLDPRIGVRLAQAGALGPKRAVAAAGSAPWLLGRGPSLGILSQINAVADGSKPAILDRNGTLTWREVDARANRLAGALRGQGLGRGDVLATLLRNGREQVEAILAAQKIGVAVAPLNTWAKVRELEAVMERTSPAFVIFDPRHFDQAKGAIGKTPTVPVGAPYEDLLAGHAPLPPVPLTLRRAEPRIIHTSGTTGKPKAAARSAASAGVRSLIGLLGVVHFRSSDVIVCPAPLFHSFGLLSLSVTLLLGGTVVLPEKFDPDEALELIEEHRASAVSLVPVMVRRILDLPKSVRTRRELSSLRIVLTSGSVLSPDARTQAAKLFGDVLYDLYGSTEAGWVAIAGPEDMAADPRTLGKPVPGVEVAIFGDDGERRGAGEKGTLHVRSDAVFDGYASGEDVAEREGFLDIGDIGWLDDEGRLFVQGRSDDMVVVGGENVYPIEVEETIEGIEGVRGVAVVGVPDDEYGHVLAAFVEGKVDPERIKAACRRELASFKVPKIVEVVDQLPRTDSGKVLKKDLAASPEEDSKPRPRGRRSAQMIKTGDGWKVNRVDILQTPGEAAIPGG